MEPKDLIGSVNHYNVTQWEVHILCTNLTRIARHRTCEQATMICETQSKLCQKQNKGCHIKSKKGDEKSRKTSTKIACLENWQLELKQ